MTGDTETKRKTEKLIPALPVLKKAYAIIVVTYLMIIVATKLSTSEMIQRYRTGEQVEKSIERLYAIQASNSAAFLHYILPMIGPSFTLAVVWFRPGLLVEKMISRRQKNKLFALCAFFTLVMIGVAAAFIWRDWNRIQD